MFAEMLSHSEEIIFLEAIDKYFESDSKFDSKNDESNENLEQMSVKLCEKLEEDEENISSTENESNDSCNQNKINNHPKYLLMKDYIFINKTSIDDFKEKLYNKYKFQVELINQIKAISDTKNL